MIENVVPVVPADHLDFFELPQCGRDSHVIRTVFQLEHGLLEQVIDPVAHDQRDEFNEYFCGKCFHSLRSHAPASKKCLVSTEELFRSIAAFVLDQCLLGRHLLGSDDAEVSAEIKLMLNDICFLIDPHQFFLVVMQVEVPLKSTAKLCGLSDMLFKVLAQAVYPLLYLFPLSSKL